MTRIAGAGLVPATAVVVGLLFAGVAAEAAPRRIVSMNLCTDQMILALVDRSHIASLSYLVAKPDVSTTVAAADGIRLNHGLAEEILPLEPDLIVAGRYTSRPTVFLLKGLGYHLVEVDISRSLADVRERLRHLGQAVGEEKRAETLIEAFDQRLAGLRSPAVGPRPTALYLQPNGYTAGRGTLVGDILEHAGFENLGARFDIEGHGRAPLEILLAADPDVIVTDENQPRAPALAYEVLEHRAIATVTERAKRVTVPVRFWICGMPETLRAVEILTEARRRLRGGAEG
jgi:iron complex transport system substrate-binding protein